jgi:hypothetical protein
MDAPSLPTLSAFTKVDPEKIEMAEQKDRRKKTELTDHFANLPESQTVFTIYTYVNGFKTHAFYRLRERNQRFGS